VLHPDDHDAVSGGATPQSLAKAGWERIRPVLAAAARCPVDTIVDTDIPSSRRFSEKAEATSYFVVAEALTNIAKHADAANAVVSLVETGEHVARGLL